MAHLLTQFGEEFMIKKALLENLGTVTSIEVGLYDDNADSISDTDDVGAITTEPADGNYARKSFDFGTTDFSGLLDGGDVAGFIKDHTFDVTNTTGEVDSYFIVINFQSTIVNSESGQNKHLIGTGALEQRYSLGSLDTLDNNNAGIKQS